MPRPIPPSLTLPGYIAWLPPLVRFVASALNYQQEAAAHMDELEDDKRGYKLFIDTQQVEIESLQTQLKGANKPPPLPDVEFIEHEAKFIEAAIDALRIKLTTTGGPIPRIDFAGSYDSKYYSCTREAFQKLVDWDWTNTKKWLEERFDCDDFAFIFKANMALAFGFNAVAVIIDRSSLHAYNLIFLEDGPVVFEPQDDTFHEVSEPLYQMQWCELLV